MRVKRAVIKKDSSSIPADGKVVFDNIHVDKIELKCWFDAKLRDCLEEALMLVLIEGRDVSLTFKDRRFELTAEDVVTWLCSREIKEESAQYDGETMPPEENADANSTPS